MTNTKTNTKLILLIIILLIILWLSRIKSKSSFGNTYAFIRDNVDTPYSFKQKHKPLKVKYKKCKYWGITLKPSDEYVPDWNKLKKIFKKENNGYIEYGDLYIYEMFLIL